MKTRIQKLLVGVALVGAATLVQAQFTYTDNGNGTCTITGYTGPGGAVTIPDSIAGLSVVSIGSGAFEGNTSLTSVTIGGGVTTIGESAFVGCTSLTNVTIPASVTSIGPGVFVNCYDLTAITVDPANSFFSSVDGVFFDKNQTTLIQFPASRLGSYAIPASVTNIGWYAFYGCTKLASVVIPNSVTSIGYEAFRGCYNLTAAYFLGNPPLALGTVFAGATGIVYYLPGAAGWGTGFGGLRTELWNPQASAVGVIGGHFGFNITGPSNTVIVVEACTNLAQPVWLPVSTNALDGSGASSFSDSQSGIYPARFYRFRSP